MWKITRPDAEAVLNDELAKKSLARYFAVVQNEKTAKFLIAKRLPAEFDAKTSLETLWKEHMARTEDFYKMEKKSTRVKKSASFLRRQNRILT